MDQQNITQHLKSQNKLFELKYGRMLFTQDYPFPKVAFLAAENLQPCHTKVSFWDLIWMSVCMFYSFMIASSHNLEQYVGHWYHLRGDYFHSDYVNLE